MLLICQTVISTYFADLSPQIFTDITSMAIGTTEIPDITVSDLYLGEPETKSH